MLTTSLNMSEEAYKIVNRTMLVLVSGTTYSAATTM